jgi:hypothetical protein
MKCVGGPLNGKNVASPDGGPELRVHSHEWQQLKWDGEEVSLEPIKQHVYRRGAQAEGFLWCDDCAVFLLTSPAPEIVTVEVAREKLREHPHATETQHRLRYTARLMDVWVYVGFS